MKYILKELVNKIPVPSDKKTKQKEYLESGTLPIIDQGKIIIGGFSNQMEKQLICDLPVIVFGDHTCNVKYINFPFGAGADGIKVFRPKNIVVSKYLYYGMQYLVFCLTDRGYGRHYQHLEKMSLNVPSISKQEQIVKQIEESLSQLDSAVATLNKTKQQLEIYRQSLYTNVINNYKGEIKLLSEIADTIDGDRGKNYPKKQDFSDNDFCLFLTTANVRPYGWNFDKNTFITYEKDKKLKAGKLKTHDIVITTRGTLGNIAVYDDYVPYENVRINSCMLIIRVKDENISPYYIAQYLMSPMFKSQVNKQKSGTAQPQIPAAVIRSLTIRIPCHRDQILIIKELERKNLHCDRIEKIVNQSLQHAEALRQSILKQAFEEKYI